MYSFTWHIEKLAIQFKSICCRLKIKLHLALQIFQTTVTIIELIQKALGELTFSSQHHKWTLSSVKEQICVISTIILQPTQVLEQELKRWSMFSLCEPHIAQIWLEIMFRELRNSRVWTLPWRTSQGKNFSSRSYIEFPEMFPAPPSEILSVCIIKIMIYLIHNVMAGRPCVQTQEMEILWSMKPSFRSEGLKWSLKKWWIRGKFQLPLTMKSFRVRSSLRRLIFIKVGLNWMGFQRTLDGQEQKCN